MGWSSFITNHTNGIAIFLMISFLIYKFVYLPLANEGKSLEPEENFEDETFEEEE